MEECKMAKAKAKWLEGTNKELLVIITEAMASGDEKEMKRAVKAVEELNERTPDTDGDVSVGDVIELLDAAIAQLKTAYQAEVDAADDESETPADVAGEDEEDEEGSDLATMTKKELVTMAKDLGMKNPKKKEKEELIAFIEENQEDAEDESEDEEDAVDYSELDKADLKALCKERGIKTDKKMKAKDIIKLLEADDEE